MIVNTPRSQSRGFLSGKNVYFVIFGLLLVLGLCCTLGPRLFSGNSKDLGSVPEIHSNSNLDAGNGRIASQPSVEPGQETKNSSDDDMPPIFLNGVNNSYVAYQDPQNDPSSFSGTQSNMNFDAVNGGIASQPSVGSERNTDIPTHIDDTLSASDFNGADQSTLLSAPPINAPINFAQNSDGIFSTTPKLYQPLTSYIPVQTSGPNTDPTIWECPSCTFPNASSAKACKICNAKNENIKTDSPSNSNLSGANGVAATLDSKQTSNVSTEFGQNSGDSLLGVQQHNSNSGDSMVDALQHNPNSGTPQHDPNSDDSHSGGSLLGDLFQFQTLPVKPYVPTVYHGRLLEQMSDPKTDPTIWECPSCTFPNASSAKACKICNAKNENIKTASPSIPNVSGANRVVTSLDSKQASNVSAAPMVIVRHLEHKIASPKWNCRNKTPTKCEHWNSGLLTRCEKCDTARGRREQNFAQVNALFKSPDAAAGCTVFFQNQSHDTGVCPVRVLNNMFQKTGDPNNAQFTWADWRKALKESKDVEEAAFIKLGTFGGYEVVDPLQGLVPLAPFTRAGTHCVFSQSMLTKANGSVDNIIGFIINKQDKEGGHWKAYRQICGRWYFMESLDPRPREVTLKEMCIHMTSDYFSVLPVVYTKKSRA
eukprot:326499_1